MPHTYTSRVVWTGNTGEGTVHYKAYARTWDVAVAGKAPIHCSNDPLLGGDPAKMNPEDLLLSALSACHMLWFLHYASENSLTVTGYEDEPLGEAEITKGGAGRFIRAVLQPVITLREGADLALADQLHHRIKEVCFIARSVSFPVDHQPRYILVP
ncbi:OsmC family protein [Pseudogemmobacter bohemicus]|uniref:OsmC family protein n=1 Tax=Pseudogemmobacter bohemicus TaxID=2250708 RepID=UPI000DD46EA5|nr:OsmC family protein [Pseudogemmobacter bohemicus]